MSNDGKLTPEEARELIRQLPDEQIEMAVEERKRREALKLREQPWGECECGHKFTMYDKLYVNYCPNCGAELDKDE